MIYKEYQRNHVILPGREKALEEFLKSDIRGCSISGNIVAILTARMP